MDTHDEIISLIFKISRVMREGYPHTSDHAFSFLQIKVLGFIDSGKEPTMKDIADNFSVTCPSATAVIDRLAELGNIRRIEDPADRRIVRLALTDKGKSSLQQGLKDLSKMIKKLLSRLSEKEKEDLKKILAKIIEN